LRKSSSRDRSVAAQARQPARSRLWLAETRQTLFLGFKASNRRIRILHSVDNRLPVRDQSLVRLQIGNADQRVKGPKIQYRPIDRRTKAQM